MAAKIAGCDPIVAVDVHAHRLALAQELGATHTIDYKSCPDVVGAIRNITGSGVRYAAETSALPAVLRQAIESLMPGGTVHASRQRAAKAPTRRSKCRFCSRAARARRGAGRQRAEEFIPKLVDLVVEGKFPIEKMITFYELPTLIWRRRNPRAAIPSSRCCACRI